MTPLTPSPTPSRRRCSKRGTVELIRDPHDLFAAERVVIRALRSVWSKTH